ncbi:MAG TPA: FliH/SctL family protein, partial [Burkholderiaceae bacterium]|nr:FliH/SctL family protein [Burkholderiaceae bacterium]
GCEALIGAVFLDGGYKAGHQAGDQAGHETGFAQGYERGIAQAAEQAAAKQREAQIRAGASLATRIDSLSDALAARFAELEAETADELVALALELAQQALRSSLAIRPEAIVDVVREALAALLDERSRVRVHLNPADAELVRAALAEQTDEPGREIVCDPAITPGGCRIETPRAEIDAQVQTRWRRTLAAIGRNEDGSLAE